MSVENKKEELTGKFFKRLAELGRSGDKKTQLQGMIDLRQIIHDIWQNGHDYALNNEQPKNETNE
jgi:hypothetical protein